MTDLGKIEARLDAATPGPWMMKPDGNGGARTVTNSSKLHPQTFGPVLPSWGGDKNAEFIAHAPTDIAFLLARVRELEEQRETVLALHLKHHDPAWHFTRHDYAECAEDHQRWPCRTVRALKGDPA